MKKLSAALTLSLAVVALPTASQASTISLNAALANVSFETSVGGTCPASWSCTGGGTAGTTTPTAAQYPAPNGLSSGFVPDGTVAAFAPVTGSTGVTIQQTLVGQSWTSGNTYTLDFYIGNPLGGSFLGSAGSINIYLLLNGTAVANLCDTGGRVASLKIGASTYTDNSGACQFNLPTSPAGTYTPNDGKWLFYQLSFLVGTGLSGDLGVGFGFQFSGTGAAAENGSSAHLDLPGPATSTTFNSAAVPEPATLTLLGLGLAGVASVVRRRARR